MALQYTQIELEVLTSNINETESTKCDALVDMFLDLVLDNHS